MDEQTAGKIQRYRDECATLLELAAQTRRPDARRHFLTLACNLELLATRLEGGWAGRLVAAPGDAADR